MRTFNIPFSLSTSLLLAFALLFPLALFAAEHAAPPVETPLPATDQTPQSMEPIFPLPEPAVPGAEQPTIESSRNYLSGKIANFASSIDRFFGGNRHYQESNDSVIQLNLTRVMGYGGYDTFKFETRVNLKLPVTEGKMRVLLETDPETNIAAEPIPGSTVLRNKVVIPRSAALAARFATEVKGVWHFSTDAGLRLPIPITPFVRARGRYSIPLKDWRLNAEESVYWFNSVGVGETTQFDLERIISAPLLFRASTNATWLYDKQNFDLHQDLTFFHQLNERTALRYQASASGISNPQLEVTDYVLLVFYRYRLHRQWLFFEISPQLHFPKENDYRSSPTLSMRLEMLFDESR